MAADKEWERQSFGHIIRERRIELGLTQEALAARIGEPVRQSDISRLENDYVRLPRHDRLEALAAALEVSPGYLLLRSGWMTAGDSIQLDNLRRTDGNSNPQAVSPLPGAAGTPSPVDEAVERAKEVIRQTDDLLRQSATTLQNARRRRGGAA